MDFNSILKFVEEDFHLPALNDNDRHAPSLLTSLDFKQKPSAPLVLKPRTCPSSDLNIHTSVSGEMVKLLTRTYGHVMLVRLKDGTIVTLLIGPSTPIEAANGSQIHLSAYQVGDRVTSAARPDPQRALVYGAGTTKDLDILPLKNRSGLVVDVVPSGNILVVQIGKDKLLVDLDKSTTFRFSDGSHASLRDLALGDTVEVTGLENTRRREITTAATITIREKPREKGTPTPTRKLRAKS
jgi:hypothetical protein